MANFLRNCFGRNIGIRKYREDNELNMSNDNQCLLQEPDKHTETQKQENCNLYNIKRGHIKHKFIIVPERATAGLYIYIHSEK